LPLIESIVWGRPIVLSNIAVFKEITEIAGISDLIWFNACNEKDLAIALKSAEKQFKSEKIFQSRPKNLHLLNLINFDPRNATQRFFRSALRNES